MLKPEKFDDVENSKLRAYNRTITALTLFSENGGEATASYLDGFDEKSRAEIVVMLLRYREDPEGLKSEVRDIAHAISQ